MENCFEKKFKGTVNNNNLPYLGYFVIEITGLSADMTVNYKGGIVKVLDGSTKLKTASNVLVSEITNMKDSAGWFAFTPGTYKVLVDKYALDTFNDTSSTSAALRACMKLNVEEIMSDDLTIFNLHDTKSYGDLDKIVAPNISSIRLNGTSVTGTMSKLGEKPITAWTINNCKLRGSIESFVASRRAAGQTENSNGIGTHLYNSPDISFDGVDGYETQSTDTLTWTTTTITLGNVTVDA